MNFPDSCWRFTMFAVVGLCSAQQVSIPRIEQMPNSPTPYLMRNWRGVAQGYDSLVFDQNLVGTYLPLVSVGTGFGLSSYVGQDPAATKEAINCLPAVAGASLVNVDKRSQYGVNWVSKCKTWFNSDALESVYLNTPGAKSGNDWWYDVMPNVFFYQLLSHYPDESNMSAQGNTVADRWLAALGAMGAGTRPWSIANIDHRAWYLSTMTPNNTGVHEPEAAGAIAWILYSAFARTGNSKYRIGAELAMESLLVYPESTNPSYELQLPYGAYIAARMNAELNTSYDVQKLLSWCFSNGLDNPRHWGVTTGRWGGYDCYGLIGETSEATGNGYPFAMNTFEQIGALVPLVRYDSRFARIIGKWVLNAANASRLFYTKYLPDQNQDGAAWSHQFDSLSLIAHESLHQFNPANGTITPYATGDAVRNGNPTNFALYGSSHVGILGAIIDTTNVPMIVRLDVLKTDYFHSAAYPTFLFFNPDTIERSVSFDAGMGMHDLYDAASHGFLALSVSGTVLLPIPANAAILVVNCPAGGSETHDLAKLLINGVVVDYRAGFTVADFPPRIKSLAPDSATVIRKSTITMYCTASDIDQDSLAYAWYASGGILGGTGPVVTWTAPDTSASYLVTCVVSDGHGASVTASDTISVVASVNHIPVISKLKALPRKIALSATASIQCLASDVDGNTLTYQWSSVSGGLAGHDSVVSWSAPSVSGNYFIRCTVDDGHGGMQTDSIGLEVRDFAAWPTGDLVASYTFSGNANDSSGNHHDGNASGGSFTTDRFGHAGSAYSFDGSTSSITVPNDAGLNFTGGITVSFRMSVHAFYNREQYPISHGNWPNRWKISITNGRLRWTLKTGAGIKDLDSESPLLLDSLYQVCVTYNGSDFEIYLNGALDAFTQWSGSISTTAYDLTMGQALPGNIEYGFNGVLDDVRIFNYTLSVSQIAGLQDVVTGISDVPHLVPSNDFLLEQNFPNPFNPSTQIRFFLPFTNGRAYVRLQVFDLLGRSLQTLVEGEIEPGFHAVAWDAARLPSGIYYCTLVSPAGTQTRKMIHVQ